jgi:hypothetical protein
LWTAAPPAVRPRDADAVRDLRSQEIVLSRGYNGAEDGQQWLLGLDVDSGRTHVLVTFTARRVPVSHGLHDGPYAVTSAFTVAGGALWIAGTYGGQLVLDGAAVQTDTVVRPYCELRPVECFGHDGEWAASTHWEPFVAHVPLTKK